MACFYIPAHIIGLLKICLITLGFIFLSIFVLVLFLRSSVVDNWEQYKCNPMVLPFAGAFGFDSKKTLGECINKKVRESNSLLSQDFDTNFSYMNEMIGNLNDGLDLLSASNSEAQEEAAKSSKTLYDRLNNTSSTIDYLGIKTQTIFQKIVAVYTTLLYASYSLIQGVNGIATDKELQNAVSLIVNAEDIKIKTPLDKPKKEAKKVIKKTGKGIKNVFKG